MAATKVFEITFNNPARSYFPGGIVSGNVTFDYPTDKNVKNIKIIFVGKTTIRCELGRKHRESFRDGRTYFDKFIFLVGSDEGNVTIPKGRHTYPFAFQLPLDLPSSFYHYFGNTVYYTEAVMTKQGGIFAETTTSTPRVCFTVNGTLDLNNVRAATTPVSLSKDKNITWCFWSTGRMYCSLNMAKSGFVHGEQLLVNVDVDNQSCSDVTKMTLHLIQKQTFVRTKMESEFFSWVTKEHLQYSQRLVGAVTGPSVTAGERKSWIVENLPIPFVQPTQIDKSKMILLQYEVEISIDVDCMKSVQFIVPIIIGTVPCQTGIGSEWNFRTDTMIRNQINSAIQTTVIYPDAGLTNATSGNIVVPSAPICVDYSELPPPTYEEAVGLDMKNTK